MNPRITLKPLDAYFLGGERNFYYGDIVSQLSLREPYFIRSNKLLSQSAAFGVLRYLGIHAPLSSFDISDDSDNIGLESYQITRANQKFGRISRIFPVLLADENGKRYVPVPRNQLPVKWSGDEVGAFLPFQSFQKAVTLDGIRYLPTEYDGKRSFDGAYLLCLEDGTVRKSPFTTQVRVGINRRNQRTGNGPGGFFKKEYVVLKDSFSFQFDAQVEDSFFYHADATVYIGQGHSPFAAHVVQVRDAAPIRLPACCQPAGRSWESVTALSDLYFPGSMEKLKKRCSLMLADSRDYRTFSTNHKASTTKGRFTKGQFGLKLIPAGSVFLFLGTQEQTAAQQANAFCAYWTSLEGYDQAKTAGFNQLYCTAHTENGGN